MQRRKLLILIISVVLGLALIGVVAYALLKPDENGATLFSKDASILDKPTLNELFQESASVANVSRLSDTLTPPTNSWISGLALQEKPLAVYPMPLSFQAVDTGFTVGLPKVVSAATTITGGHTPGIEASIQGATSFKLSSYDKTSATLTYQDSANELGSLTIAQGSPYVFYRANAPTELIINNASGGTKDGETYRYTKAGTQYVVSVHDNASFKAEGATVRVTVPKDGLLTLYALPENAKDTLEEFAGNEIQSVAIKNEVAGSNSVTKFEYKTANNKPTVMVPLPYQSLQDSKKLDLKYESVYGDMQSYEGNSFAVTAPLVSASNEINVKDLSQDEKSKILTDLKKESQNITVEPQDTYFAGKQLARIANLLSISEQLGEDEISKTLKEDLTFELTKRLGKDYFYYDSELKGVAAKTKAFGSEDFNDHHFHYGYFIYAASILGKYDASFVNEYKNEVNLLVADIASYETYEEFPVMRNYDPYSAHSWAAGLAPFQDGNNQESSSEALNAWNAVTLWAQLIGNKTLEKNGQWMLSNEAATAATAWRNVDTSASYLKAYTSPVASLSFGGKRTYSTFFSDESNTKLGIQLIPMSPVMETFASDGDEIKVKLSQQTKPNNYNVALGDYSLMYLALSDKDAATKALEAQTDEFIDDGNSRTYLRAWIYTR